MAAGAVDVEAAAFVKQTFDDLFEAVYYLGECRVDDFVPLFHAFGYEDGEL